MIRNDNITVYRGIEGGEPVFTETKVKVQLLFDHLAEGGDIDSFVEEHQIKQDDLPDSPEGVVVIGDNGKERVPTPREWQRLKNQIAFLVKLILAISMTSFVNRASVAQKPAPVDKKSVYQIVDSTERPIQCANIKGVAIAVAKSGKLFLSASDVIKELEKKIKRLTGKQRKALVAKLESAKDYASY